MKWNFNLIQELYLKRREILRTQNLKHSELAARYTTAQYSILVEDLPEVVSSRLLHCRTVCIIISAALLDRRIN